MKRLDIIMKERDREDGRAKEEFTNVIYELGFESV
jgi:hypothetical protein